MTTTANTTAAATIGRGNTTHAVTLDPNGRPFSQWAHCGKEGYLTIQTAGTPITCRGCQRSLDRRAQQALSA